ncbi:TlyA family RNA methyltransferase [Ideonella paludis]|uniref:TlyA family RNA methyltransferase n=1 Tax=Ideonella paludis TaxID=1233411 RepID=A0ABS5DZV8_9BURK|nr:TlyA family RNA methyltransferase [Ideonella paludis]MBQ0936599.1 TlyA family RNA methyltransferase [Ideonella paludis]
MRVDQLLVQQGLAPTRSAAQRLIEQGAVRWLGPKGWTLPKKAGEQVPEGCTLEVTDDAELRWASRAGLKLEGVLSTLGVPLRGATALDVGQSTGGFTDVLLAQGCAKVVGVDVGHDQLAQRLREDPRVAAFEGLNARELTAAHLGEHAPAAGFDFITGDLSFISLALVLPALVPLLAPGGRMLMLVKPQFELQPVDIGRGGLVKSEAAYGHVEAKLRKACGRLSLSVVGWHHSPITGGDGNKEFFIEAVPAALDKE